MLLKLLRGNSDSTEQLRQLVPCFYMLVTVEEVGTIKIENNTLTITWHKHSPMQIINCSVIMLPVHRY